jgi:predicted lipoprotein with Yx(FWY)xxD motif
MQKRAAEGFSVPQLGQRIVANECRRAAEPLRPAARTTPRHDQRKERPMRWILLVLAATLGLAACSNSSSAGGGLYGGGSSSTSSSTPAGTGAAEVATADVGDLGTVLVDGNGMTLYLFESDTGSSSTCTGTCAETWPALTTSNDASSGGKASASMLGTTTRDDGSTQVTYNGHPLYLYSGDTAPGDANGQDIGDVWYAVTAQGTPAEDNGGGSKSGGGGGGYGNGYGGG